MDEFFGWVPLETLLSFFKRLKSLSLLLEVTVQHVGKTANGMADCSTKQGWTAISLLVL